MQCFMHFEYRAISEIVDWQHPYRHTANCLEYWSNKDPHHYDSLCLTKSICGIIVTARVLLYRNQQMAHMCGFAKSTCSCETPKQKQQQLTTTTTTILPCKHLTTSIKCCWSVMVHTILELKHSIDIAVWYRMNGSSALLCSMCTIGLARVLSIVSQEYENVREWLPRV